VSYIWIEVDKKNNIAYIDSLATDERFRRKGYGELLLNHVLTKLEASGTKAFQLHVFVLNREAIDLYKKYGFQKIDCIVDHYGPADSNKNSAYLMERNLDVEYKQI
jgi:ribosomal-protein-alanine N-acetyltransferase